ncbi:TPA: nucleotidyltransferase domain-containing protein [Candidatus Poribacteria bacterium]|nr:nucleotidyltransferase domain-containing protein [Candidatus Poribacteria bacterium]
MVKFDEIKLAQLCRDLNLSLVALFGSQATGKTRVDSDIDIAVLSGQKSISPEHEFEVFSAFLWFFHRADCDYT